MKISEISYKISVELNKKDIDEKTKRLCQVFVRDEMFRAIKEKEPAQFFLLSIQQELEFKYGVRL